MPIRVAFHLNSVKVPSSDLSWIASVAQSIYAAADEFADDVDADLLGDTRLFLDVFVSQRDSFDFDTVPLGSHIGRITNPAAPITATIRYVARDFKGLSESVIREIVNTDCHAVFDSVTKHIGH
jgi:hypothetical protein